MRLLDRSSGLLPALALGFSWVGLAAAAPPSRPTAGPDCLAKSRALLRRAWPDGVDLVRRAGRSDLFAKWLAGSCACPHFGLPGIVHESVHALDARLSGNRSRTEIQMGLYLGAGEIAHVPAIALFPRSELASAIRGGPARDYAARYLDGRSGTQGLASVLEELNAYTHELESWPAFADRIPPGISIGARDGAASFLLMTAAYLRRGLSHHPTDARTVQNSREYLDAIRVLWGRAESALDATLDDDRLGIRDREILGALYGGDDLRAAETYFVSSGRPLADRAIAQRILARGRAPRPSPTPFDSRAAADAARRAAERFSAACAASLDHSFSTQLRAGAAKAADLRSLFRDSPEFAGNETLQAMLAFNAALAKPKARPTRRR